MEGRWVKTLGSGWKIRMPAGSTAKPGDRVPVKRADDTVKMVRLGMRCRKDPDGSVVFDQHLDQHRSWSGDVDPDYDDPSHFDEGIMWWRA